MRTINSIAKEVHQKIHVDGTHTNVDGEILLQHYLQIEKKQ
jgi:hypothetical protein